MIDINDHIQIPESELAYDFVRAGGPGGQHVNKSSTAVQLRFNVVTSPSLPEPVRQRLIKLVSNRINDEGVLIISSSEHRSQLRNREAATQRLIGLIRQATHKPRPRKKTRPSRAAKQRRLDSKKRNSRRKSERRKPIDY